MAQIVDIRSTVWRYADPVSPMPPNFCTTPDDLVARGDASLAPFRFLEWLIVEVELSDGTIGIGNAALAPRIVKAIVDGALKPLVVSFDPLDTEYLWQSMYRRTVAWGRQGAALAAISAVDLALWDAKGKLLGQPVFKLLGGRTKDRIPVYASRLYAQAPDIMAAEARAYVAQGFGAVKLRFGYGPRDGVAGLNRNVAAVKAVREAIGDDVDLMGDAYMGWDLEYAKRMVRALGDYGLRWIEEPLLPDDVAGYAELKAMNAVAIAGGEHEFGIAGYRQLLDARAIDIAQFDTNRVGGITAAKKIADMCGAQGVTVVPHAGQMHNYHVTMSSYASPIAEYFPKVPVEVGNELFWYIFEGEPVAENGSIDLSDTLPGLGLTLKPRDPAAFTYLETLDGEPRTAP